MDSKLKIDVTWYVYLLSNGSRSYVGLTNDPAKRLRQHNGEISGGASSTKKSPFPWFFECLLSGFISRGQATTWENLIKKRSRGLKARRAAMEGVAAGICPVGKKQFDVPTVTLIVPGETTIEEGMPQKARVVL